MRINVPTSLSRNGRETGSAAWPRSRTIALWFPLVMAFAGLLLSPHATAEDTNAPAADDFDAFRVIAERNIFNPGRTARRSNPRSEGPSVKVDSFALVGTMSYEKGCFAFFDGNSADFRKVLQTGGVIAGYSVKEITPTGVILAEGDKTIELKVNSQLRREDDGEWQVSAHVGSYKSSDSSGSSSRRTEGSSRGRSGSRGESRSADRDATNPSPSPSEPAASSSPDDANEVLKRLMEQREKELK